MALSIADYLLQLPENMNFAKVQELSGEDSLYYRMLSDYGSGSFQLIRFENDLLMILIADYTPKETFEKIATISEEYMEISQFETDSSSFKIGRRKTQPVGKGIYCYVNTQKTTYVYCEKGKPVRFTKIILTRKYFDTYFRVHYGKDYEQSKVAKEYLLKNPNLPELNFVFQQIRDCQAVGQTLHLYLESKVLELLSLVIKGMEQKENHISVKLDYKDTRDLKKTVTFLEYLQRVRLNRIQKDLLCTDYTIQYILDRINRLRNYLDCRHCRIHHISCTVSKKAYCPSDCLIQIKLQLICQFYNFLIIMEKFSNPTLHMRDKISDARHQSSHCSCKLRNHTKHYQ